MEISQALMQRSFNIDVSYAIKPGLVSDDPTLGNESHKLYRHYCRLFVLPTVHGPRRDPGDPKGTKGGQEEPRESPGGAQAQRDPGGAQGTPAPTTWSMTAKIWFRRAHLLYLAPYRH